MFKAYRTITLVELILILVVLIFLVGVSIKQFPDVSRKSQLLSNISNMENVFEASVLFEAQTSGALPDDFDTLLTTTNILNPALLNIGVPVALLSQNLGTISTALGGGPITPPVVLSELQSRGLTQVRDAQTSGITHQTFNLGTAETIGPGIGFCTIRAGSPSGDALLATLFKITDSSDKVYLCVGIGSACSLVGNPGLGLNFAPVYLPDVSEFDSISIENNYFRFVNIYEMSVMTITNGTDYINIRFLGTVRPNELDTATNPAPGNDPFVSISSDYEKLAIEEY